MVVRTEFPWVPVGPERLHGCNMSRMSSYCSPRGARAVSNSANFPSSWPSVALNRCRVHVASDAQYPHRCSAVQIVDMDAIAAIAKEAGLPLIVDSTFSTPYLQQPLKHGDSPRFPSFSALPRPTTLRPCYPASRRRPASKRDDVAHSISMLISEPRHNIFHSQC